MWIMIPTFKKDVRIVAMTALVVAVPLGMSRILYKEWSAARRGAGMLVTTSADDTLWDMRRVEKEHIIADRTRNLRQQLNAKADVAMQLAADEAAKRAEAARQKAVADAAARAEAARIAAQQAATAKATAKKKKKKKSRAS